MCELEHSRKRHKHASVPAPVSLHDYYSKMVYFSAVKRLIAINRIKNKSFCLLFCFIIYVCVLCIFIMYK